jgi:hypothetical protein
MHNAKVRLTTQTEMGLHWSLEIWGVGIGCISGYECAASVHALGSGYGSMKMIVHAQRGEAA